MFGKRPKESGDVGMADKRKGGRKKCNFCKWAQVTAGTRYKDELKCTKRKKVVYLDDSCDFFDDMRN